MSIEEKILQVENQYLLLLEKFFSSIYDENKIISHGLAHHRRVWNYAKELLHYTNNKDIIQDTIFVDKLLIACYLHDIGMAIDQGIKHGYNSRIICEQFLIKYSLSESDFFDALTAIENHDNKEYSETSGNNKLLTILSVADDLDAFGIIGIYRYADIYLKRGIPIVSLGIQVCTNAAKRFENFAKVFSDFPDLIQKYERNYLILDNFYKDFINQAANYQFGIQSPSGYCGVIEIISDVIHNQTTLDDMILEHRFSKDKVINEFFKILLQE